jgi:uncharacterized protein (DUF2236 family)
MDDATARTHVSWDDLERTLAGVRAAAAGPAEGVFGPASVVWRISREAGIFLAAGRALLLQLAHPWVAAAIAEHSRSMDDPIGRFHRTFHGVFTMVFGTLEDAVAMSRQLYRRHESITGRLPHAGGEYAAGSRYSANEVPALRWVHATLVESALVAYELVLPPLAIREREQYWTEARVFGALFGVPAADLPETWDAFTRYVDGMLHSGAITVSPVAGELAGRFLAGPVLRVGRVAGVRPPTWYRDLTAHLLPAPVREGFGLTLSPRAQRRVEAVLRRIRRVYPCLPARVRTVGPYQEACARLRGDTPDYITQRLNVLWTGHPRLGDAGAGRRPKRRAGKESHTDGRE